MQTIKTVDEKFYRELGKQLRMIREERRMTLSEVSKKIGYSRSLIDQWELGYSKIKPKQLDLLCDVYDISNLMTVTVKLGFLLDD